MSPLLSYSARQRALSSAKIDRGRGATSTRPGANRPSHERTVSRRADDQDLSRGLDDFAGDELETVEFENSPDRCQQPVHELEVPAGDPDQRRDSLGVGEQ